jgi:hypothetical protein
MYSIPIQVKRAKALAPAGITAASREYMRRLSFAVALRCSKTATKAITMG